MRWHERQHHKLECERIKNAVGEWVAMNKFSLFGTATYKHPQNVRLDKAHKDAAHFARLLSRRVLGKHTVDRQHIYLPMMMFVERGKNRDNTHLHFFTKGYTLTHTKQIVVHANCLWQQKITNALDVVIKDEREAQRRTYTMKEQLALDDEILSPQACYLQTYPH